MRVDELMTREVVTVTPETPLEEVAALLIERRISGVPVRGPDDRVVGIVSERDILYKELGREERSGGPLAWFAVWPVSAAVRANARTAGETMSSPALTIEPSSRVGAAARLMIERDVDRLPVVEPGGALVGIVTRTDLVRAFAQSKDETRPEPAPRVLVARSQ